MSHFSVKRHSAKRHSAKKHSAKKHSAKKHSAKKRSVKKRSVKKDSVKKRSVVKSQYRMRGMGILLNMYGGATEALEKDIGIIENKLSQLTQAYDVSKDDKEKQRLKTSIEIIQRKLQDSVSKLSELLNGATETVNKAMGRMSLFKDNISKKISNEQIQSNTNDSVSSDSAASSLFESFFNSKKFQKGGSGSSYENLEKLLDIIKDSNNIEKYSKYFNKDSKIGLLDIPVSNFFDKNYLQEQISKSRNNLDFTERMKQDSIEGAAGQILNLINKKTSSLF